MSITAKEIAKRLNISEAAVSMALNNKAGVSVILKSKIIEEAQFLGYDFSRITLKSNYNGVIAFVAYKRHGAVVDDTSFFRQVTDGIINACKSNNYTFMQYNIYGQENLQTEFNKIVKSGCNGMLILGTEMLENDLHFIETLPIPTVVMDVYYDTALLDYIIINNFQGAYLATNYLIKKRKTQPGYLRSSYPITNFSERANGFFKAINENGFSSANSIQHFLSPSYEGAYADMKVIIKNEKLAKSYFADNDLIALGAMKALKEAGIAIPKEVAIVGFDDIPICTQIEPQLTSINVPKSYLGLKAITRLMEIIKTFDKQKIKIEINVTLSERKSV